MSLNLTNFSFALKTLYPREEMVDLVYKNNPWLAMVAKNEKAGGDSIKVPLIYGNPQGRSSVLSTAITNKGNTLGKAFYLTRVEDYAVASISRHAMKASMGDAEAFAEASEVEIDGAINTCTRSLAKALYRSGSGALGQISAGSNVSTDTITLANINDITNFEVAMILKADSVDGSGTVEAGNIEVESLDSDAGTITAVEATWDDAAGIPTVAAEYYLFQEGDYGVMLKGLAAWIPASAPSSSSFFGVDRTAHKTRLGGVRVTGTGMPIEQALLKAAARVSREGGMPDTIFLNDVQYHQLIVSLGSKVEYVKQGVTAEVYFSGVVIHGPRGPLEVYPDFNCPSSVAYVLQLNTWKLYSLDMCPHIFDEGNDQEMLREATTDGYEVRVGYYAQLGCTAPGYNATVSLDAATF